MKVNKTNAARLLDKANIVYELIPYQVDESDLAATHVAEQLGENIEQVFKTLVLRGDKTGIFVCVIPGNMEVDLKAVAKISGNKSAEMIAMKELLPVTGYIRGGCSPIGMKKQNRSRRFDKICFCRSRGDRNIKCNKKPGFIPAFYCNIYSILLFHIQDISAFWQYKYIYHAI